MKLEFLVLGILLALVSGVSADYWTSSVSTDSSSWSITRQSGNISFSLSSAVDGNISPTELHGRVLGAYQSHYAEVKANDVRLRERTSSLEGKYRSEDDISLRSRIDNEVDIEATKPAGSNIYTFTYHEQWPVLMTARRTLEYSGRQINDRDFAGNNGDFVGSNLLYNRELSKEQRTVMWLDQMNATVLATDDAILQAEFMPTKYLGYLINAKTTGIADLSYQLRSSQYDVKHQNYPVLSEGEERYYGTYDLSRKIEMKSVFEKSNDTDDGADSWLPCCYAGWNDMMYFDKKGFGTGAKGVFDCTCFTKEPLRLR